MAEAQKILKVTSYSAHAATLTRKYQKVSHSNTIRRVSRTAETPRDALIQAGCKKCNSKIKGHAWLPQPSTGTCIPNSVAGVACDSTYSISRKWFSKSKHVRRPRLSYCELQNPITGFGFSELVVLQVGSFLAKKSSCTFFQKIQRTKSQIV